MLCLQADVLHSMVICAVGAKDVSAARGVLLLDKQSRALQALEALYSYAMFHVAMQCWYSKPIAQVVPVLFHLMLLGT